jgi:hypothetical protein
MGEIFATGPGSQNLGIRDALLYDHYRFVRFGVFLADHSRG